MVNRRIGWLMAAALALPGAAMAEGAMARMSVTGTGEIRVLPDMATVTLGVEAQGDTADAAMAGASDRIAAVLKVLAEAGVAPEDVQTAGLMLNPVYEPPRNDVNRPPRMLGFEASNTLNVTVRDLDRVGGILDKVIAEGANSFRGLSFGLQDPVIAHDDARREAVADALGKAQLIAEAAGGTRGPILSIEEGGSMARPEFGARLAMADAGIPIAPGSLTVREDVVIVFGFQP